MFSISSTKSDYVVDKPQELQKQPSEVFCRKRYYTFFEKHLQTIAFNISTNVTRNSQHEADESIY